MKSPKFTPAEAAQIEKGLKGHTPPECTPLEKTVIRLMDSAFCHTGRTPRSTEYRNGARALLLTRLGVEPMQNPYQVATAQADAWWAGVEEGKAIYQFHCSQGLPT